MHFLTSSIFNLLFSQKGYKNSLYKINKHRYSRPLILYSKRHNSKGKRHEEEANFWYLPLLEPDRKSSFTNGVTAIIVIYYHKVIFRGDNFLQALYSKLFIHFPIISDVFMHLYISASLPQGLYNALYLTAISIGSHIMLEVVFRYDQLDICIPVTELF